MKLTKKLVLLSLSLIVADVLGQSSYNVQSIPDELRRNANVVVREKVDQYSIKSSSNATLHSREVITILNPNGRKHATKAVFYDKLTKVVQLKATVYDANGKQIKKLKTSDFEDYSAISGFSLYEDNRIKIADLSTTHYPYTIEFEYELDYKFLFYIPTFNPIWDEHMSAQSAQYSLLWTGDTKPRYKLLNLEEVTVTVNEESGKISWSFTDVKPFEREKHGPSKNELLPAVSAAPSYFQYDGYAGNMDTWENFGKWISRLNKDRDELSVETKQKVIELTKDLNSVEEKCRVLYSFLQNKTRYVSIQLGIGGFQPFEARVVDEVGYGDCKALSNYMVALLKVAGVKSNYTLIRAGGDARPIDAKFPSTQFNHVIVSVPNGADTLWLECTSQSNPFKYLGTFTGNRYALAITDQGGKIVRTPDVDGENVMKRMLEVMVDEKGKGIIKGHVSYLGQQYEKDNLNFVSNSNVGEQKKWIEQSINLPSFRIENYTFENHNPKAAKVEISYNLSADRIASTSGKRLFLAPNLFNKLAIHFSSPENRVSDVIIEDSIVEFDSIEFHLPENIYPEFIPANKSINNQFGAYEVNYTFDEGRMFYVRKFILNKGRYSVDTYAELCAFNKEVSKTDNISIAFLNKT